MNTLHNYKINEDSNDIIHIVLLPFILKDTNVIKMLYYDKEIYFVGLYTLLIILSFLLHMDGITMAIVFRLIRQAMFGYGDIVLDIKKVKMIDIME